MSYAKYQSWKFSPLVVEPYISVVIPVQDVEKQILIAVDRIASYMSSMGFPWELIVCDTGSKDKTVGKLKELRYANLIVFQGKAGHADQIIQDGMLSARGRFVLFEDIQDSTPIEEIRRLLPKVAKEGYDLAIGCRGVAARKAASGNFPTDRLVQSAIRWILKQFFTLQVDDPACTFRLYSRHAAQRLFKALTLNGTSLQVESIYLASRFGYRIAEVPVGYVKNKQNVQALKKFSRVIPDLVRTRWNEYRGRYKED
jgi:dolichyl-phosphate beta-glucosyltransferase